MPHSGLNRQPPDSPPADDSECAAEKPVVREATDSIKPNRWAPTNTFGYLHTGTLRHRDPLGTAL
jgi:hypothetical protein